MLNKIFTELQQVFVDNHTRFLSIFILVIRASILGKDALFPVPPDHIKQLIGENISYANLAVYFLFSLN